MLVSIALFYFSFIYLFLALCTNTEYFQPLYKLFWIANLFIKEGRKIQIHDKEVHYCKITEDWLNYIDPSRGIHL